MTDAILAYFRPRPGLSALAAFLAGSASAFSMAPYQQWPLLFLGLSVLFLLQEAAPGKRRGFLNGWCFGFGYFVFGLYWIGNALLIDGNPYAWAWPLAVAGLPAALAFYPALACMAMRWRPAGSLHARYGAYIGWMALSEWVRGHALTGFPWNLFGYTWADHLPLVQMVSFSNVYFLSLLTIGWAALPGFLLLARPLADRRSLLLASLIAASFIVVYGYGALRLQQAILEPVEGLRVHIIQPNIPQAEKWQSEKMMDHFLTLLALSEPTDDDPALTTYIVWPETALSYHLMGSPYARGVLRDTLSLYRGKVYLLTGMLRHDEQGYYNSLVAIDRKAEIVAIYDKAHLVPFGEYIPFQQWIPLAPIVAFSGFVAGPGPDNLVLPEEDGRLAPIICYEAIFPAGVVRRDAPRPDFIVNVTNDGWYGISPGPYQHLVSAQFRAVEEGIPLIRAANTGISAYIDGHGHIQSAAPLASAQRLVVRPARKTVVFQRSAPAENGVFLFLCFLFIYGNYIYYIRKNSLKL